MKELTQTQVYKLNTREVEDIIDEVVRIPRYPGYDWHMWNFHISEQMNNDTSISFNLEDNYEMDEDEFISTILWCQKMHEVNAYLDKHKEDLAAYKKIRWTNDQPEDILEENKRLVDKVEEIREHVFSLGFEDRPEDYMGCQIMRALQYAKVIPPGSYVIEASW